MRKILSFLLRPQIAEAHCDVPCGIYTAEPMKTAARTVLKMVEKINELTVPGKDEKELRDAYKNSLTRMIQTKEVHAQKCKEELLILWTDYFKPEHLDVFANLHESFWKAAKLCSKAKQTVSKEVAEELVAAVDGLAELFEKAGKK